MVGKTGGGREAGDDHFADAELADVGGVVEVYRAVGRGDGEVDVVLREEIGDGETYRLVSAPQNW